jgi:hypothetical protein
MRRLPKPIALFALVITFTAGCGDGPAGDTTPGATTAALSAEAQSALAALPAGAAFLGVADAQALQQSGALPNRSHLTGETGARLQDFLDATGFDPAEDVQNVYVAKPRREAAPPQLVVAADFDRADFEEQLTSGALADRFEKETYQGRSLYRRTGGEQRSFSFALTADGLILFAPKTAGVRRMIDRLDGNSDSIQQDDEAMRLADRVRGRGDTWFVTRDLASAFPSDDTSSRRFGRIAEIIRATAGALSVSDRTADGELFLYTKEGAAPADLKEVLEGLVSALASHDELDPEKRRALESIEIEVVDGEAVHVRFSFPMSSE